MPSNNIGRLEVSQLGRKERRKGDCMEKFLMLGKYSSEAVKGIASERTKKAVGIIEKNGGKVHSMLTLLGIYDLALMVEFPGIQEAIKSSVTITQATGVGFTTLPAVTVEEFDKLLG